MDEIDQAQAYSEDFQAFALRQHQLGQEPGNYTGIYCMDCDDEIPEARRKAMPGCCRCVDCQEEHENKNDER